MNVIPAEYVDYAIRRSRDWLRLAKAEGVRGVVRYYDGDRVPGKGLTREECEDLDAVGLPRHVVFQTSGGADIPGFPHDGDYFTYEQGRADWLEGVADALAAGQPRATPLYMAVDRWIPPTDEDGRLRAYFQGTTDVEQARGATMSGYHIGVYGRAEVCEYIRDTFGITHLWPWTPRPPAYPVFECDIWQYENAALVAGQRVDRNLVWLPGWGASMPDYVTREELEEYKVALQAQLDRDYLRKDGLIPAHPHSGRVTIE